MTTQPIPEHELPRVDVTVELVPPGWYSGDTHEHIQYCDDTLHTVGEIRARMEAEDLNVAAVLIWHRNALLPFVAHVCNVTGQRDPLSSARRWIQFGVETSGLTCARWGHIIALGIGPDQARIALGSVAGGACADMPGLGLEGDGTGTLCSRVAAHFYSRPSAVCGYAHTVWTDGLYHPEGRDWNTELLASGFTTDAVCLDPGQKLAVPNVERVMAIGYPPNSTRAFFPLLGAMDAALGNVQFFETVTILRDLPVPTSPPASWTAIYYKLLSAGVRIALSGGTDRACLMSGPGGEAHVRTYALTDRPLSFGAWIRALAAGRTSVSSGSDLFLSMQVNGADVGSDVFLEPPGAALRATVRIRTDNAIDDAVELVANGEVVASLPLVTSGPATRELAFPALEIAESAWVAARLASLRAHTAAVYAIVGGKPVSSCTAAEYWMLWCDIVTRTTLLHPELPFFGAQKAEALALIAAARRAFKTHRDVQGFDPAWNVTRYGRSTPACRGPIAIGTHGPALAGQPLRFSCVNAPPLAQGTLHLSRAQDLAGTCDGEVDLHVDPTPGIALGEVAVQSTRSGYSEVEVPPVPPGTAAVYAQFVWTNPPSCRGTGCAGGDSDRSASDALALLVS
jgi:hypothetical protein